MRFKIISLTAIAMVAFATNSILCRFALKQGGMDPAVFTLIRLGSGGMFLWLIIGRQAIGRPMGKTGYLMPLMLTLYALFFSFAYQELETGTGALIIFSGIQATMLLGGLVKGERPSPKKYLGMGIAMAGLAFFVFPGLSAPSPGGAALMGVSGICWGMYSLLGKNIENPAQATMGNFIWSLPMALFILFALTWALPSLVNLNPYSFPGIQALAAALASGALASGAGYMIWYKALQGLSATQAGLVQMSVPVIAAAGGILFLSEPLTLRFLIASTTILAGLGLALSPKKTRKIISKI